MSNLCLLKVLDVEKLENLFGFKYCDNIQSAPIYKSSILQRNTAAVERLFDPLWNPPRQSNDTENQCRTINPHGREAGRVTSTLVVKLYCADESLRDKQIAASFTEPFPNWISIHWVQGHC